MAKSVFFGAFLSLCYVSTTLAALALGPAQVHPSQPNFCFQESKEKFYKPGETWTLEGCMQAECVMVSNSTGTPHLMVSYASCGIAAVDPPCYLTENKAAAYPDCCPEPVCPDSVEEEEEKEQVTPVENQKEISSGSSSTPSTSSNNNQAEQKYEMEERKGESMEASSEDSSENEIHYNSHQQQPQQQQQQYYQPQQYHHQQPAQQLHQHQEQASEEQRRILSDFFRGIYPSWDHDDYLYGGDSHMDNSNINNVDDLQYLDYNPASRSRFSLSPKSRFTRHDFNIANFGWF